MKLFWSARLLQRLGGGLASLVAGAVLAQSQSTDKTCPPAPMPLEQQMAYVANSPARNAGLLWRIEKDGRSSWLYGTVHLNHIDFAKPGPQVMMGMRSSDILALELNPYEPQRLPADFKAPEFKLSAEQEARLRAAYAKDCLNASLTNLPPAAGISSLLASQAQRGALFFGYSPDSRLAQIAHRTGKPVVQLETPEQQIMALAPKSQAEFDQSLSANLDGFESGAMQSELIQLNLAWQKNDWVFMQKLEQEITAKQPAFAKRLLDQRNILMAEKIDSLHQSGKKAFVAVGALHMAGQTGLPTIMQQKGYAVTFIPLRN